MQHDSFLKNPQLFLLGLCIAAATIASSFILSGAFIQVQKTKTEIIDVTGSAEKNIFSDYAVWRADITRRDPVMTTAHAALKTDLEAVREFLLSKGVQPGEITVYQVETQVIYVKNDKGFDTPQVDCYQLIQRLAVSSRDVRKVLTVSQAATDLIDKGLWINSQAPEFFYTKLADLKLEMLALASSNARKRAEHIAKSTKSHIGILRKADMGVFQITPVNSTEVSDYGCNDTTSMDKKVTAIIHASFAIS